MVIYKYPLDLMDICIVQLPFGYEILNVIEQDNKLVLYAFVDPGMPIAQVPIRIVGTGNPFPDREKWDYLTTVKQAIFVWHTFTRRER